MPLATRLLHLIEDAFTLGVTLASDAIDSWTTQETRGHLLQRLREASQRGAELALENARLKDELDAHRFNGPSLYRDETEALYYVRGLLPPGKNAVDDVLQGLLGRCDHLPFTAQELSQQIEDVLSGKVKTLSWDDVFKSDDPGVDVDDSAFYPEPCPECHGSPRSRIERCTVCGNLGRDLTGDSY